MNPYAQLVASLVAIGRDAITKAVKDGLTPEMLSDAHIQGSDQAALVFDYLAEYVAKYTDAPDRGVILAELGIDVGDPPAQPHEFWIDKVKQLALHRRLVSDHGKMGALLNAGQTYDALEFKEQSLLAMQADNLSPARVVPLFGLAEGIREHYKAIKGGMRGVPFPWPSLNEATLGMWPEDLILFAARTGVGKSWTMALIALHAWKKGHKVLFGTTELSQRVIAQRLFSMHVNIPYGNLYRGRLDQLSELEFFDFVDNVPQPGDHAGFDVIGGDFDFRIESLSLAIQDSKPALVILDGAYLLKTKGKTRTEAAAGAFNELKRLAKQHKVPIVTTTQFNRKAESSKTETLTLHNIGLTDVGGWNADLVFALFQTDDMKRQGLMKILNLKGRETMIPDIDANWAFENMDFSEIRSTGGGDADPYGVDGDPDDNHDDDFPF